MSAIPPDAAALCRLSPAQLGFWTAWSLHPDRPMDSRWMRLAWYAPLDVIAFEAALEKLVQRTDSLRLVFQDKDQTVLQYASTEVSAGLDFKDFSAEPDPVAGATHWLNQQLYHPLNLRKKVFHTSLAKLGPELWHWQLNQHHIATDFTTARLHVQRLAEIYEEILAGKTGSDAAFPSFLEYLEAHRAPLEAVEAQRAPIKNVGRLLPSIEKEKQSFLAASTKLKRLDLRLGQERIARAATFCKVDAETSPDRLHSVMFTSFLATAAVLVSRLSLSDDVVIGTPTHNRYRRSASDVAGLMMRTLPIAVKIGEDARLSDVLKAVQKERRRVFSAASKAEPIAKLGFNVIINHITTAMPDFAGSKSHEWRDQRFEESIGDDLHITIRTADIEDDVRILFDVNEDILNDISIDALSEAFLRIFDEIVSGQDTKVSDVPLTGETALMEARERTKRAMAYAAPAYQTLHDGFVAQAKRTPAKTALIYGKEKTTYKELEDLTGNIARALVAHGVQPGQYVALHLERSIDVVATMLGIMRSGAVLCAIDTDIPKKRAKAILEDTGACLVICASQSGSDWIGDVPVVAVSDLKKGQGNGTAVSLPNVSPDAPCYVMYTSGSTGVPKGIVLPHGSVARCMRWFHEELAPGQPIDWAFAGTLSFDAPYRMFTSLVSGGAVKIYPDPAHPGRIAAMDVIEDDAVDALTVTPSQLRVLVKQPKSLRKIRIFQVIGEMFPTDLARKAKQAFGEDVHVENWYGPTEATLASTRHRFDEARDRAAVLPVGLPAPDVAIHVLDQGLNPVPTGAIGEVYIGGNRLSLGYLGQPELTDQVFLPDPFGSKGHIYRTGDLGRLDRDGHLVLLGRADSQVKVNGVRIELTEVEMAIARTAAVSDCTVVPFGDDERRLAAFLSSDSELETRHLRASLQEIIPPAMVPTVFKTVQNIPYLQNGKVDRKLLAAWAKEQFNKVSERAEDSSLAPSTPTEKTLAGIWEASLPVRSVGQNTDFHEAGGDSLAFVQMVLATEAQFGIKFPADALDENCNLASFAALVDTLAPRLHEDTDPRSASTQEDPGNTAKKRVSLFRRIALFVRRRRRKLNTRRLKKAPVQKTDLVSQELLRQLRVSISGWPGEHLSEQVPVLGFNLGGTKYPIVWCFNGAHEPQAMAERLGADQPLLAFRSMSKVVVDKTYRRAQSDALARIYADAVHDLLPGGVYNVGGNCQAGLIAECIARHLLRDGCAVPQLSVLEYVPETPYPGRIAFFFGDKSRKFNPFYEFDAPQLAWETMHKEVRCHVIPGEHAMYFNKIYVDGFMERLNETLTEANERLPIPYPFEQTQIHLRTREFPVTWRHGESHQVEVTIHNAGHHRLNVRDLDPIKLCSVWREAESGIPYLSGGTTPINIQLLVGASETFQLRVEAPGKAGDYTLAIGLCVPGLNWAKPENGLFEKKISII